MAQYNAESSAAYSKLPMMKKQLASTVRQGRRISVIILDEDPIEGYLAGWDDEGYFLVHEYDGRVWKTLVPKTSILRIDLFDDRTFRDEIKFQDMDKIVKGFRDYINKTYFKDED